MANLSETCSEEIRMSIGVPDEMHIDHRLEGSHGLQEHLQEQKLLRLSQALVMCLVSIDVFSPEVYQATTAK